MTDARSDNSRGVGASGSGSPGLLRKYGVQVLGFALGIGLLAWCVSLALGPQNREQLAKLKDAHWWQIASLLGLSLTSLFINGVIFQLTMRPVRKLSVRDVCSVNAVAAFLGYLPLKLGFFLRVGIHVRRDRIPLLTVGAWFAAVAIPLLGTAACLAGATLLARRISDQSMGPVWYGLASAGLVGGGVLVVAMSRLFGGEAGRERLRRIAAGMKLGVLDRFIAGETYAKLNTATTMLGNPAVVGSAIVLRVIDFVLQSIRFVIAANIIGATMPLSQAFVVASSAFLIGIVSPGGPVGSREAGVLGVFKLLGVDNPGQLVLIPLLVTATEAVAYMIGAVIGIIWLGPRKLFAATESGLQIEGEIVGRPA